MADKVVLDGELSLNIPLDGEAGAVIEVGHGTGIDTIVFNADYTLTFNMTNGETFTTGSIRGEQGQTGAKGDAGNDYILTQQDKEEIAGMVDTPVDDVQINGTSIVQDGVANVPVATASRLGVVYVAGGGLTVDTNTGRITTQRSTENEIKAGTNTQKPTVPINQHQSTFYGLAKAAGDTTQSQSSNPVGIYTEEAKTAIRTMLGIDKESLIAEIRGALNL